MKTIINKTAILLLLVGMVGISCDTDEFLDVNENPNNPSISTPSLTLPVAQQDFAALNARTLTYLGNQLAVNWATPSNWSANSVYMRYDFTANDFSNVFEQSYLNIFKNLTYVETYEDESGAVDYSAYKVISNVIKGFQYQILVDLYGDIPYSEANLRGEITTPKYDDAETIYKSVIDKLTAAAILALDLPDNAEDPGSQDIIFSGHMDDWAAFANTIKLRMLVRLSNTGQGSYISEQIASITANGAGFITSNASSNPGYTTSTSKQSPFFDYFVIPVSGNEQDRGDYTVLSDHTSSYLSDTNDPRLAFLYTESASGHDFKGAVQSTVLPGTGFTSNDLAKVGPGLLISAEQDQPIMLLAEALFIQAEATVRGYLPGGDAAAKILYQAAITESFTQLEVPDASTVAEAYYTQLILNVAWEFSPDKIEAIITQKWIALNGTSSIESWIDLTRTGFPLGLPIPDESQGVRPVRLLYPASETSRNSNNVPAQSANEVFTDFPFWK